MRLGKSREKLTLDDYPKYLFQKELSEGTRSIYVRQAKAFLDYMGGRKIDKEEIVRYKQHLTDRNLSVSTLNLYIVSVNSYLRYAGYTDCIVKTNRICRRKSLENVISKEEYRELINYTIESGREKYYYILKTLALTGIRVSELSFFTVEILNKEVIMVQNKGKIREIYLPDELIYELRVYCRKNQIKKGVIFKGNKNTPISRIAVYKMLASMADIIGIPKGKVHPHSFRHLFAVTYMEHYANLFELADLMGHSSLETTRIYAETTVKDKRDRLNRMGL